MKPIPAPRFPTNIYTKTKLTYQTKTTDYYICYFPIPKEFWTLEHTTTSTLLWIPYKTQTPEQLTKNQTIAALHYLLLRESPYADS